MILSDMQVRVWLYKEPTDMRKSFRGLIALVKNQLEEDPLSGHLFAFINKRRNYIKVLYYSKGGFCIWMKKLTQGCFNPAVTGQNKQSMSWQEFQWLVEGIEFEKVRYRKRHIYDEKWAQ